MKRIPLSDAIQLVRNGEWCAVAPHVDPSVRPSRTPVIDVVITGTDLLIFCEDGTSRRVHLDRLTIDCYDDFAIRRLVFRGPRPIRVQRKRSAGGGWVTTERIGDLLVLVDPIAETAFNAAVTKASRRPRRRRLSFFRRAASPS